MKEHLKAREWHKEHVMLLTHATNAMRYLAVRQSKRHYNKAYEDSDLGKKSRTKMRKYVQRTCCHEEGRGLFLSERTGREGKFVLPWILGDAGKDRSMLAQYHEWLQC